MKTTKTWDVEFLKTGVQSIDKQEDIKTPKFNETMNVGYQDSDSVKKVKVIKKRTKTEKYGFFESMFLKLGKRTQIVFSSILIAVFAYFSFSVTSAFGNSVNLSYTTVYIEAQNLKTISISNQDVLDVATLKGDITDTTAKTLTFEEGSSSTFTGALTKGILVARVIKQGTINSIGTAYNPGNISPFDRNSFTIYLYTVKELPPRILQKVEQLGMGSVEGVKSPVFVYKISNEGN